VYSGSFYLARAAGESRATPVIGRERQTAEPYINTNSPECNLQLVRSHKSRLAIEHQYLHIFVCDTTSDYFCYPLCSVIAELQKERKRWWYEMWNLLDCEP
jgi:hypothetical protein